MRRLYEWEPLMDFICATLGQNQKPDIGPRRSIAQFLGAPNRMVTAEIESIHLLTMLIADYEK
jgi:hypothetical protein